MPDDLTLLASTYLDGEATPDERARVEADPSLLAEVERLRAARTALFDPTQFERPGDNVREAAIASALTAWDLAERARTGFPAAAPAVARRSPVVRFERRPSYTRWLSAAAAVVAVAALGVVVAQLGGGEADEDSSTAFEATSDTLARAEATDQSVPPPETADALVAGDVATDDAGSGESDADAASEAAPTAAAATQAPADTTAADAGAAEPAPQPAMETPEELGAFAAEAEAAVDNDTNRNVLARPCADDMFDDIDTYVAMGRYRGRLVVIGIDDQDERAIAVDPDTCEIVAEAPLP